MKPLSLSPPGGGKKKWMLNFCLFIFILCLFTSAIWSKKLSQFFDWILQSSFPALFQWNSSFSKNSKSAFYQRIHDEDRRRELNSDRKSPNCTRLLRHLGSEDDLYDCPNCRYFTYCHRLGVLLDNCLANEISQNNFISRSSMMTNTVSGLDNQSIEGSNLLFISFDPIGSNRHIFTKKLLSNFVSSLQKTERKEPVLHTPAVSCQSFVSAVNLESKKSRVLIYGPKTFGIHEVLSQDRSNMYVLWAKHPFQQVKDTYEFLYHNWNYILNAFPKKLDDRSRNFTAYFTSIEKFIKSSNGSLEHFLFSVRNVSVAFLDNQMIRSLLYSMPVFPSYVNFSQQLNFPPNSSSPTPFVYPNSRGGVKGKGPGEKEGIENNDLNFFQSHEQSITLREPPLITQVHYARAVSNVRKYIAYVGVNEQFEESTELLCHLLNLSQDCFGGPTMGAMGTHRNSRSPTPVAAAAGAPVSATANASYPSVFPDPSSPEWMKAVAEKTSLSASVIDILQQRNFWDLKLYAHLSELSHYQLQTPLANHFFHTTSTSASERNTN